VHARIAEDQELLTEVRRALVEGEGWRLQRGREAEEGEIILVRDGDDLAFDLLTGVEVDARRAAGRDDVEVGDREQTVFLGAKEETAPASGLHGDPHDRVARAGLEISRGERRAAGVGHEGRTRAGTPDEETSDDERDMDVVHARGVIKPRADRRLGLRASTLVDAKAASSRGIVDTPGR
jgi:hypothetical protein